MESFIKKAPYQKLLTLSFDKILKICLKPKSFYPYLL